MKEVVLADILVVDIFEGLIGLEEYFACEQVDCLRLVEMKFLLDDHDELKNIECFQNEDSMLVWSCTCCYRTI